MPRWAECAGAARRLVVALAITLLGLLIPASPGFASSRPSQQEAAPYVYDSHHHRAPLNHPGTERGQPSSTNDHIAGHAAVDHRLHGTSACPDALIVAGYTTYDALALTAHVDDVAGTSGHAQVNDGEFLALTRSHTAAKAEAGSIRGVNPLRGSQNCVNCAIATDLTLGGGARRGS